MLVIVLVSACSSMQVSRAPQSSEADERIARLSTLTEWSMEGRIAVKQSSGGGQGRLSWQQAGNTTDIRLAGPLGAGAMNIHWVPEEVTVRGADLDLQHRYSGEDAAEKFLAEQLGWSFPAGSIRYWLLGIPNPAYPYRQQFSISGELLSIQQLEWLVEYQRFALVDGRSLPAKLQVEGSDVRLRLVVDDWNLSESP
ncbi:MAG: lipoprotein insertase outer membrane protein LolB [Gammaproteobacteria bacterium]|nr:lipoprotein insertase outer membrane protein LolB [Gammaproteobacteria bacterium]